MTGKQEEAEASTKVNSADRAALISTDGVQGNGSSSGSGSIGTGLMTLLAATARLHALGSSQQKSQETHQNEQTIEERTRKKANEVQPNDHLLLNQMIVNYLGVSTKNLGVESSTKKAVSTEADKVAWMSPNACEGPNAEEQRSAIRKDLHIFDTSHDGNLNLPEIKVMPQIVNNF